MRTSTIGLAVILSHFVLTASAFAQVCSQPKGTYETYGDIVVDKTTKLAWKRCSEGQSWNGASCSGQSEKFSFRQALGASAPAEDGFAWRIPRPEELATLVVSNGSCLPAIDQEVFPRTVPGPYWTSQLPKKDADAAICQSFGAGASGSQREQCWIANRFSVRLVSALPLKGYLPAAPTSVSFHTDDSGTHLIVFGSNFSRTLSDNVVNFPTAAGLTPVVPTAGTTTTLTAAIPDDATSGRITVTTKGVTSQPALGTLRVINNKDGCAAAGFTPATIPQSSWEYCVLPGNFTDTAADVLIIGAHPAKLPSAQPSYILSTSHLSKAASANFTLNGRIAIKYGASGVYGVLVIHSNTGQESDSLTTTGTVFNNGAVENRGNFTSTGSFLNTGNGVIFNSGVFTNNPTPENSFTVATTGRTINGFGFVNASGPGWPRAQLRNLGILATDTGSTGIENSHGDIVNSGTLLLQGALALINRSGSAPGTVTNNASMTLKIVTQPEGVPILMNEPGATIVNNASGTITNARVFWTFINNGVVRNCGTVNGMTPGPNDYLPCTPRTGSK